MAIKITLAFCKERNVCVYLNRGSGRCVLLHQCFIDDACPLDSRLPARISTLTRKIRVQDTMSEKVQVQLA
jgi:hypothetical protein